MFPGYINQTKMTKISFFDEMRVFPPLSRFHTNPDGTLLGTTRWQICSWLAQTAQGRHARSRWLVFQSISLLPSRFLAPGAGKVPSWDLQQPLSWMWRSRAAMTGCRRGVKLWPRFLHKSLSLRTEKILLFRSDEGRAACWFWCWFMWEVNCWGLFWRYLEMRTSDSFFFVLHIVERLSESSELLTLPAP